jgi:hypothetical protein
MKMKRTVILGVLCGAFAVCQLAVAADPEVNAMVSSSKKSRVYATKDEAKDYRVSERTEKRTEPARKNVVLQPRLTVIQPKHRLPWAPYAPGD